MNGRLLIVDDDKDMRDLARLDLSRRGFTVVAVSSAEEALRCLAADEFDSVITDLNMPGMTGLEFCDRLHADRPDIPVVVITAFGSLDSAIAAIRAGAYDFVIKPIELDLLAIVAERAVTTRRLKEDIRRLRLVVEQRAGLENLLGSSSGMQRLFDKLTSIADVDSTVLIVGESGTGKELVAKAIHSRSHRHSGPFVAINCAALPETLLESELFGHVQGAFTDARSAKKGLLLQAHRGTLLLDEIGDMPLTLQPKLLRALENRTVRPVGGETEVPFDARVVASTNRDIESLLEQKQFREDLYYRINVVRLDLPPLRERGTDILLLAREFLKQFSSRAQKPLEGISEAAAERLLLYSWPGNVRELKNVIDQAVALATHTKIVVEDLPERVRAYRPTHLVLDSGNTSELVTLEQIERRYILHVLEAVRGNRTLAARILGLDRKTLWRKLRSYGVSDTDEQSTPEPTTHS